MNGLTSAVNGKSLENALPGMKEKKENCSNKKIV